MNKSSLFHGTAVTELVTDRLHGRQNTWQTPSYTHASRLDGMQLRLFLSLFSIIINTRNQQYNNVHDKIPYGIQ
jgi:hypothetical protein